MPEDAVFETGISLVDLFATIPLGGTLVVPGPPSPGRQRQRCPRCSTEIAHFPQAGRTTWSCPRCQPDPPPPPAGGRARPKLR